MKIENYFEWVCVGLKDTLFPDIYCPSCNSLLIYDRGSLKREETSNSKPDNKKYIIACKYSCKNCNEPVMMLGLGHSEDSGFIMSIEDSYSVDSDFIMPINDTDRILYTPLFFTPTVHLFNIPRKCPTKVKDEIIKSFSLFWNDVDSCVNKLRLSIELLMDSQEINKMTISPNGIKPERQLTLHKRIDLFKMKNQKAGELLEAIKWIGNKGSHADNRLIANEVFDAYKILEHALNELYEPKIDAIYDMAKEINKRKGTHSRSRKI